MELLKKLPSPIGFSRDRILELLLSQEYGFLPPAPETLDVEETSRYDRFCAGKAPLQELKFTAHCPFGDFSFPVSYFCPKSDKPVPCVVLLKFGEPLASRYLPAEEVADQGYAVLSVHYQDISTDNGDFTNGLAGLIYPEGKRRPDQCGKLGLWAWAAIRMLEYALTLPEIDHARSSVAGHSRLGKTALLAGALEPRFFCAWSNNSGCGGAALARENTGETVADICRQFPYWFCENYYAYTAQEDAMPFDQHFLLAANASHRVYVASAADDAWACPKNEYLSCVAAGEYFKAEGKTGFVHPVRLPAVGESFHDGDIGYHLRPGCHYMSREDWNQFIHFANAKI